MKQSGCSLLCHCHFHCHFVLCHSHCHCHFSDYVLKSLAPGDEVGEGGFFEDGLLRLDDAVPDGPDVEDVDGRVQLILLARQLLGRVELGSDLRSATLFHLEPLPASARIRVAFDATSIQDRFGRFVDADGDVSRAPLPAGAR